MMTGASPSAVLKLKVSASVFEILTKMSKWNLSPFRACLPWAGDNPIFPWGDWKWRWGNQPCTVVVHVMALGNPSSWAGKQQRAWEPKITSTFTARASLIAGACRAFSTSSPVLCTSCEISTTPWEVRGGSFVPLPSSALCNTLPSPVKNTCTRKQQE